MGGESIVRKRSVGLGIRNLHCTPHPTLDPRTPFLYSPTPPSSTQLSPAPGDLSDKSDISDLSDLSDKLLESSGLQNSAFCCHAGLDPASRPRNSGSRLLGRDDKPTPKKVMLASAVGPIASIYRKLGFAKESRMAVPKLPFAITPTDT